jgi:hypothetical protein
MSFNKALEVVLTAALTLFIGLYFRLAGQIEEMTQSNIAVKQEVLHLIKTLDRHELEIQKIKVEMLTMERTLSKEINQLRLDCLQWFKKTNERIDRRIIPR